MGIEEIASIILCGIILITAIIGGIYYGNRCHNFDYYIVLEKIKNNEPIDHYDVEGRPHEQKILKLLKKNNYELVITEVKKDLLIYAVSAITYKDKVEYNLHFSEKEYYKGILTKDNYNYCLAHVGETAELTANNVKRWVKKEK